METTRASRPVAVSGALVGVTLVLHAGVMAGLVWGGLVPFDRIGSPTLLWSAVTWMPSLLWAALVLARAAQWRVVSAFWLPGAAALMGMLMFLMTFVTRAAGVDLSGVGTGSMLSSWVLLACAFAVAVGSRLAHISGDSLAQLEEALADESASAHHP